MNVDVSPDGGTLVFDLLGDIYRLPTAGGDATALTSGRAWDQAPRFSPDGKSIFFVSDREGYKNIWRLILDDQTLQQVTRSKTDIVGGPSWSQDGNHLLVGVADAESHNSEFILHAVDPKSGSMTPIDAPSNPWIDWDTGEVFRPAIKIYSAVESADGEIFFSRAQRDGATNRITVGMHKFLIDTQTRTAITPVDSLHSDYKPQLSRDGNLLAYFRQYNNRHTEIRILNRTTGHDEALVALTSADDASYRQHEDSRPNYAFSPDNRELIYWHGGKIHRVNLADGSDEIVPFRVKVEREVWAWVQPKVQHFSECGEASVIRWPSVSHNGQTIVFAAIGYVWVMDMKNGDVRRLTSSTDFEYMPALSPDGTAVAFISFAQSDNGYSSGRLMLADLEGGPPRELLAERNENYLVPKWSGDGSMIALIREVEGEAGFQEGIGGIDAAFGWTSVTSGAFHEVAPAPSSKYPISWFIYSRFVGFDKADRNLLFSFPRSSNETVLARASLDGGFQRKLAISTPEVGGITPAPDLNNLALTRRDGTIWLIPFAVGEEASTVSTLATDARRVSDAGGYYVDWSHTDQITFGFGQNIYRYHLDEGEQEFLRVKVRFAKPKAEQPVAFRGARLITVSDDAGIGPVIESGTVVVDGARFAAIGPVGDVVIPAESLVIDATGKTIMPGLLDTHYHRIGGWGLSAFRLPNPNFSDQSAIAYGVTSAWEPGGPVDDGVPATVDLQAAGRIVGPRWSHSARGLVGYPWKYLTNYTAALAAVEQHRALGVNVLKEYTTPTRQQRQWLSAAARETGVGIVSHLNSFDGTMTRIVDGYTGGDHPRLPAPFYKDVLELLRQTGYIWTPNTVITSGTVGREQNRIDYFCYAVSEWQNRTSPRVRETDSICPADPATPTIPYDTRRFSRVAKQAASAASNGAHIGISAHNMPGSGLHQEMWFLWKGGMPIEAVLRTATIRNAEKLGLHDEVGSLESGKIADFLVLDENPLDDILNTLSVTYTVQGGVVYDSDTALPADINSTRATDVATVYHDE